MILIPPPQPEPDFFFLEAKSDIIVEAINYLRNINIRHLQAWAAYGR